MAAAGDTASWRPIPDGGGWRVAPLDPAVAVRVSPPPPPDPPDLAARIDTHWAAARRDRPALFNGRVFSVDRVTPGELSGHWTEYRRVLAQLREPGLFATLALRPLAVNGLLECADGLLLGRRDARAVYQPGAWQAPPAGNVEHRHGSPGIDLRDQLLAELEEELGLGPAAVAAVDPAIAIEHDGTHVVDIGLMIRTPLTAAAVIAAAAATGNAEYDRFRTVAKADAARAAVVVGEPLLPSALALLEDWARRR